MPVYDIVGKELQIGQKVCFGLAQTKTLTVGVITKINPKTVTIDHISRERYAAQGFERSASCLREFHNVVVVADV